MNLEKFSDADSVTGYVKRPDLQKENNGNKYFDMRIPLGNVQYMGLEDGDLLEILLRNREGDEMFFKRSTSSTSGEGLKFYVPRKAVKSLGIEEDSLLEVFVSKD